MAKSKFEFKLRKLLTGNFFGMFRTIFKGEGLEPEDIREYVWGDDPRYINWKVSAKYNKLFVNVFRQERDVDLHLFVDINSNIAAGVNRPNFEKLKEFLTDFFIFARKNGINVVGFLPEEKKIQVYQLKNQLDKLYFYLKKIEQSPLLKTARYISFLKQFLKLEKKFFKRHVIMIVSDFLDLDEDSIKLLKALDCKNEIVLVKIDIKSPVGKNYLFKGNILQNIKPFTLVTL